MYTLSPVTWLHNYTSDVLLDVNKK